MTTTTRKEIRLIRKIFKADPFGFDTEKVKQLMLKFQKNCDEKKTNSVLNKYLQELKAQKTFWRILNEFIEHNHITLEQIRVQL